MADGIPTRTKGYGHGAAIISVSCLTSLSKLMLDIQIMVKYAQTVTQDRVLQNRPDYNLAVL